jgi:hypothetical protein
MINLTPVISVLLEPVGDGYKCFVLDARKVPPGFRSPGMDRVA